MHIKHEYNQFLRLSPPAQGWFSAITGLLFPNLPGQENYFCPFLLGFKGKTLTFASRKNRD